MARHDLLVLVKHALPDVDPRLPASEWLLGPEGRAGAMRLAERLAPVGLRRIVASVEPKAADTARLVADHLDLDFQTGHDLHEHRRRKAGYLDKPLFEASVRRVFAEPDKVVFGEESGAAAAARFGAAVDLLAKAYPHERMAVVAHGTVIALHLADRYGADGFSTWKALGVPSFVVVERRTRAIVDVVPQV
jgi:broad specificity phosphatase PhoE